jgi:hypothetical protein
MNAHSKKHIPKKLDNNNRHDDTRPTRDKMAMGQRYFVRRLVLTLARLKQRAALSCVQLEGERNLSLHGWTWAWMGMDGYGHGHGWAWMDMRIGMDGREHGHGYRNGRIYLPRKK